MDDLDRTILKTLQEDGRSPFTHIARLAGVSETTIRNRYAHLVKEGIVRTAAIVDPLALGFLAPAIIAISVEPGTLEQIVESIAQLPEVSYLVMTLGSYDLIVEVFCRDRNHLADLLTQHLHLMPGIRSTETLMIARSYKLTYRHAAPLADQSLEE